MNVAGRTGSGSGEMVNVAGRTGSGSGETVNVAGRTGEERIGDLFRHLWAEWGVLHSIVSFSKCPHQKAAFAR